MELALYDQTPLEFVFLKTFILYWGIADYGVGNGNPPQYSCLENFMDRGAWWATVHGVEKSQTSLSDEAHAKHVAN